MKYCVVSPNTSWPEFSAYVVSRHGSEAEARQACKAGEWVEVVPIGLNAYDSAKEQWVATAL